MLRYTVRQLAQRLLLLFVISVISFAVVHLAPGEPSLVDPTNPRLKPEDVARIRAAFHLDEPLHRQYAYWIRDLFSGRLASFKDGQPVLEKIWGRFLNSLPLFLTGTVITWLLAFPVGIRAAVARGSPFDRITTFAAFAMISVPGFFLAYLLILWVVNHLQVSVVGMRTFGFTPVSAWYRVNDRLWHLVVPSLMSAFAGIAILSRYVRSQMAEVLAQDYVRTARAKGLPEEEVTYVHALRNALLPFITMFGLMLPGLIGGSVIFEQIFAWPGMGRLAYDAILARDFPVVLTINFFAAALTLAGTLVSDLLYAVADPRIRLA
ncbi:MAG: ABC transporter permease [Nitrospirae bacterium]|nr:MAG: ABC transporter permease [Nitrospirota bacterium]